MLKKILVLLIISIAGLPLFAGGGKEKESAAETERTVTTGTGKYSEAPMLAKLVERGELPPVEERLPENPLTVKPYDGIGVYGGELLGDLYQQPSDGSVAEMNFVSLTYLDPDDMLTITPGLVEDWEYSNGYKTLTLNFRKSVKWSDGEPFSVDDVLFWYNDILMNKEATAAVPEIWKGSSAKKIDEVTVEFTFSSPQPHFFRKYGVRNNSIQDDFLLPKHYAQQFHPDYNSNANKEARDAGFNNWYQYLRSKAVSGEHYQVNPECPVLSPWRVSEYTEEYIRWERNPYFWAVDTAGNQLPYIDKLMGFFALDKELRVARVLSGQVDLNKRDIDLENFTGLKKKEKELGYDVWTTNSNWGSVFALYPNQVHKDPKKRALFQNKKFRIALSHAINRERINEVLFKGLATPVGTITPRDPVFYNEDLENMYKEYNPERTKSLFTEIGMTTDGDGNWTFPDGGDLNLTLDIWSDLPMWVDIAEMVHRDLQSVGLDISISTTSYEALKAKNSNGESDIPCWAGAAGGIIGNDMFSYICDQYWGWFYAFPWKQWVTSDGQQGEEPPRWYKDLFAQTENVYTLPEDEAVEAIKDVIAGWGERFNIIGTVADEPVVHVLSDAIGNADKRYNWNESGWGGPLWTKPFTWYFKE